MAKDLPKLVSNQNCALYLAECRSRDTRAGGTCYSYLVPAASANEAFEAITSRGPVTYSRILIQQVVSLDEIMGGDS